MEEGGTWIYSNYHRQQIHMTNMNELIIIKSHHELGPEWYRAMIDIIVLTGIFHPAKSIKKAIIQDMEQVECMYYQGPTVQILPHGTDR